MNNKDCFMLSMILNPMARLGRDNEYLIYNRTDVRVVVHHMTDKYASVEVSSKYDKKSIGIAFGTIDFDVMGDYNKCRDQLLAIRSKSLVKMSNILFKRT